AATRKEPGRDEAVVATADDDDLEAVGAHRATASSASRHVWSAAGWAATSFALSSARRSARIASRSGSAARAARAPPSSASPCWASVSTLRGLNRERYEGSVATR